MEEAIQGADVVVLLVDHTEFKLFGPEKFTHMRGRLVIDTRNCLDPLTWQSSGFDVVRVGSRMREPGQSNEPSEEWIA
jgi:UDP-N-acetyl-D-mannosaminuronic acid dehydrogenase